MHPRTRTLRADLLFDASCDLGEGPIWWAQKQELVWVDILGRAVHRCNPRTMRHEAWPTPGPVSAVVPRGGGEGLLLAIEHEFAAADGWGGPLHTVATISPDTPSGTRLNDGKCDRLGRFWAGTMTGDGSDRAAFYRLEAVSGVEEVLRSVRCSNGLAFTADDRTLFYIDSPSQRVDAFDFDLPSGCLSRRRPAFEVDRATPDGMAIDTEGCLWVALWDGGGIRRYTPDGRVDGFIEVPTTHVTSCAFGGADLHDLYITTARTDLSAEQLAREPHAGAVFVCRPGVAGTPTARYAG